MDLSGFGESALACNDGAADRALSGRRRQLSGDSALQASRTIQPTSAAGASCSLASSSAPPSSTCESLENQHAASSAAAIRAAEGPACGALTDFGQGRRVVPVFTQRPLTRQTRFAVVSSGFAA